MRLGGRRRVAAAESGWAQSIAEEGYFLIEGPFRENVGVRGNTLGFP